MLLWRMLKGADIFRKNENTFLALFTLNYIFSSRTPVAKALKVVIMSVSQSVTLKSLIQEQTGINEQAWKKVPPCLLIY